MKNFHRINSLFFLFFAMLFSAQTAGDYRSNTASATAVAWTTAANWQVYNGATWVTATQYPGQTAGNYTVTILPGDIYNSGGGVSLSIGNLVVQGTLNISAAAFTLSTTTKLTIDGGILAWTGNFTFTLTPANASIILVNGGTITGSPCNANKVLQIGTEKYASCTGGAGAYASFADLNSSGGTLEVVPTATPSSILSGQSISLSGPYTGFINAPITYKWSGTGPGGYTFASSVQNPGSVTLTTKGNYIFTYTVSNTTSGVTVSDMESINVFVDSDSDGDLVGDATDLDNDNDGILDTVEGRCTLTRTTTWTANPGTYGGSATATTGLVAFTSAPMVPAEGQTNIIFGAAAPPTSNTTITGAFNATANFWYNDLRGQKSLQFTQAWDSSPAASELEAASVDGGKRVVTITFSTPVNKVLLNIDRLGGTGRDPAINPNFFSNSTEFTLTSPNMTMSKLAGNSQFIVTPTKFYRDSDLNVGTTSTSEADPPIYGTAAGTVELKKTDGSSFASIQFTTIGVGPEGTGGDGIEMIFEYDNNCTDRDTDGDGIPDYLDLDSDNDGCPDAVEGGNNLPLSSLVASGGTLQGGNGINPATTPTSGTYNQAVLQNLGNTVDANGVPTIVSGGQTAGSSANSAVKATVCSLCYNDPNTATAGLPVNHGITLLKRAGTDNGNWPMIIKSAHTVLESNTKGFVITRMTSDPAQTAAANHLNKITNPQEGMMVYDTFSKCLKIYADGVWSCFSTSACP